MTRPTSRKGPFILLASMVCLLAAPMPPASSQTRPNIIVFLADDMGWGDSAVYNPDSKIPMPNLDRLADEGMRFTDAHTSGSVCAPTRYSAVTGNYQWRGRYPEGQWDYKGGSQVLPGQWTVADILKARGYHTAMFGKLHLGGDFYQKGSNTFATLANGDAIVDFSRGLQNGPTTYGFDQTFPLLCGIQKSPYAYFENDRLVGDPADLLYWLSGTYGNSVIPYNGIGMPYWDSSQVGPDLAQEAVDFIDRHHRSNIVNGTETPFFLYYASQSAHRPWTPPDLFHNTPISGVSGMTPHTDMIHEIDAALGMLMAALDERNITYDTLIIFTSDNGGIPDETIYGHDAVGGLRGQKRDIWEGGHRVPFVAKWGDGTPGGSVIPPGTTSAQLVGVHDIPATLAALADVALPADQARDSFNLLPALKGEVPDGTAIRDHLIMQSFDWQVDQWVSTFYALRMGTWKLILDNGGNVTGLYDLDSDLQETVNRMSDPDLATLRGNMRARFLALRASDRTAPHEGESDGFAYADDLFRNTHRPVYAWGDRNAEGVLHVTLGNVDDVDVLDGMSGGWSRSFHLDESALVRMEFQYRLMTSGYDADECGEALAAVDGVIVRELARFCGRGHDTGWRWAEFALALEAGTHTLSIGGYGNKKTAPLEKSDIYFADVSITATGGVTAETLCGNGIDDDGDGLADCMDPDCSDDPACKTEPETSCQDGVDNDGDGFTDCTDPDCSGDPACETEPETSCQDGVDNDGDGLIDCVDPDCANSGACDAGTALSADFDAGLEGFVYSDDTFRNTGQPLYAAGNYTPSGGYLGSGGLQVTIGNVDGVDVLHGMSGGWSAGFYLDRASTVAVTVRYRLMTLGYDADECGEALISVDGLIVRELARLCGRGFDTGWRQAAFSLSLGAGNHLLTLGGFGNKKTGALEKSEIYFDDVSIAFSDGAASENSCDNGVDDDSDGYADCRDFDCNGVTGCEYENELSCQDGLDNDGDGFSDCSDADCAASGFCSSDALLSADFDDSPQGFSYADDTFRGTRRPLYASGSYAPSGGFSGSGGLHLVLGNVDGVHVMDGMSGGWSAPFVLGRRSTVQVTVRYRLTTTRYDADECAEALAAVDGVIVMALARFCGRGHDTGWRETSFSRTLDAGDHVLTVGGFGNKKTAPLEKSDLYFDDIVMTVLD